MTYYRKLVGKKCFLSPASVSDYKNWSQWLGISEDEASKKIEEIHKSEDKYFSIVDSKTEEVMGISSLGDLNQLYQNCNIDIINPIDENWINGIISEAIKLTLDFAFNGLNMHSVYLWLPEYEAQKLQCFKQSGFKEMARRRQSVLHKEKLLDNIYLDILSSEYSSIFINKYLDEMDQYIVK